MMILMMMDPASSRAEEAGDQEQESPGKENQPAINSNREIGVKVTIHYFRCYDVSAVTTLKSLR